MKLKLLFTTILLTMGIISFNAQSIEIIPQINYTFGGRIYGQFGDLKIQDSESYGVSLNLVNDDVSFQLEYFYQPTTAAYRDYFVSERSQTSDLNVNWYHLGIRKRFNTTEKVVPFGGLSAGLTHFSLDSTPDDYDELSFSIALQGGTNIYLSDRIGLRLHARLLVPIQFSGFGFYAGTGGSGATATAGSYFVQGDVGAGLVIRLGD
jgi:hypothetical protein